MAALLFLFFTGNLLADQFRGAWKAGNGQRGVMLGALSIGISLALLLIQSNTANIVELFPFQVENILNYFGQPAPLFDSSVALLFISLGVLGVLRNLSRLDHEPSIKEFKTAIALTVIIGIPVGLILIALQIKTEVDA